MKDLWIKVVAYFTAMYDTSPNKTHLVLGLIGFGILCMIVSILVVLISNFGFPIILLFVVITILLIGGIYWCGEAAKKILKIKDKKKDKDTFSRTYKL